MIDKNENPQQDIVLNARNVSVSFPTRNGLLDVVDDVSFTLRRGKTLGLVGESGCGKSMSALSILRLIPPPGYISAGNMYFGVQDLYSLFEDEITGVRGRHIAMIFQDPMAALNPVFTLGGQIAEAYRLHFLVSRREAAERAVDMLARVGMPDPALRAKSYPHQLSGGMRQRAMIAMALICNPDILIADEPTTALDTTIQAQILDLLLELQDSMGMAILFISHNLAAVAEIADDIMVMYAGRIVEHARATDLFTSPRHPYTQGLIATLPRIELRGHRLPVLKGSLEAADQQFDGCRFVRRCPIADAKCLDLPPLVNLAPDGADHSVACVHVEKTG